MYLSEFFESIPPRIVGGDQYHGTCFGPNARYLDLEGNISVIFDEVTLAIYEITLVDDIDGNLIWRDPAFEKQYIEEVVTNRGLSMKEAKDYGYSSNVENQNELLDDIFGRYTNARR